MLNLMLVLVTAVACVYLLMETISIKKQISEIYTALNDLRNRIEALTVPENDPKKTARPRTMFD